MAKYEHGITVHGDGTIDIYRRKASTRQFTDDEVVATLDQKQALDLALLLIRNTRVTRRGF